MENKQTIVGAFTSCTDFEKNRGLSGLFLLSTDGQGDMDRIIPFFESEKDIADKAGTEFTIHTFDNEDDAKDKYDEMYAEREAEWDAKQAGVESSVSVWN